MWSLNLPTLDYYIGLHGLSFFSHLSVILELYTHQVRNNSHINKQFVKNRISVELLYTICHLLKAPCQGVSGA